MMGSANGSPSNAQVERRATTGRGDALAMLVGCARGARRGEAPRSRQRLLLPCIAVLVLSLVVQGCRTTENWQWDRDWPKAASGAALVGAAACLADGGKFDRKISHWATDHTPLFSSKHADHTTDALLLASLGEMGASWVARGVWGEDDWWDAPSVEGTSVFMTWGLTEVIKPVAGRSRPDDSNDRSFFSGHTSVSFAAATATSRNIDSVLSGRSPLLRTGLKTVAYGTAGLAGWGRVEAGKHYPSDVLVGAVVGYWLTALVHDEFLGPPEEIGYSVNVDYSPSERQAQVLVSMDF